MLHRQDDVLLWRGLQQHFPATGPAHAPDHRFALPITGCPDCRHRFRQLRRRRGRLAFDESGPRTQRWHHQHEEMPLLKTGPGQLRRVAASMILDGLVDRLRLDKEPVHGQADHDSRVLAGGLTAKAIVDPKLPADPCYGHRTARLALPQSGHTCSLDQGQEMVGLSAYPLYVIGAGRQPQEPITGCLHGYNMPLPIYPVPEAKHLLGCVRSDLERRDVSIRPAQVKVVHLVLGAVVVQADLDARQTALQEPLDDPVVGALRFSAAHGAWIIAPVSQRREINSSAGAHHELPAAPSPTKTTIPA